MVLPVIAAGVMAAGAIAQYMQSQEAQAMNAKERRELKALIDNLKSPNFDPRALTPEQYKVVGKYVPQAAEFVAEQAPQLVKMDSADSVESRNAQREALGRLRSMSRGDDPLAAAEQADALAQADTSNRGRVGAVREDFARRGQGGGTSEMLAQLLGAQSANQMAADGSRGAFIEAQKRKLQSLRDSTTLAGAIRDDEFRAERGNADIINSFNARTSTRRQDVNNRASDVANQGQQFNLTAEQRAADNNVSSGNDFRVNERNRQDKLTQQTYDNEMGKIKTQGGITDMARADIKAGARDRNSAIGGATDAFATGAAYYDSKPKEKAPADPAPPPPAASASLTAQPNYNDAEEDEGTPLSRKYNLGVNRRPS